MSQLNPEEASFVPRADAAPFVPGATSHNVSPTHGLPNGAAAAPAEPAESWDDAVPEEPSLDAPVPPQTQPIAQAPAEPRPSPPTKAATPPALSEEEDEEEEAAAGKAKSSQPPATRAVTKEPVNVVFIGHVDAGKSTIGGQIMKLTGMVDERTLAKYEREAREKNRETWYLSWCMDTNLEERDKGKTVELGRAFFETAKKHFTILDAPGHKSFVPNMIGGASQADLAVLVISARKGEFETGFERGGQTREHAMLVKTAGVQHLVVLVNKMDDQTVRWGEERWKEIQAGLSPYLKKIGFRTKDVAFIPCSGLTGAFIKEPPPEGTCPWYSGPCFIDYIDGLPTIQRNADGPVRVILADRYQDMGTIVLGKVESGTVRKGASLTLMPNRVVVQVVQIWSDEVETEEVVSGENVKFKLKGIDENEILSGFCLCSPDSLCKVGRVFDSQIHILEPPAASIICPGYTAVLHIHNAVEEAVVRNLICLVQKGEKIRPPGGLKFIKQDQAAIVRFETAETFCLERFDDFPQMARFTLRDEGRTIAIGKVLKVVE